MKMRSFYQLQSVFALLLISSIVAAQPTVGGYNVYFGGLHSHSNVSDGTGTPDEAYNYAKNVSHLDFFSLADHSDQYGDIHDDEWIATKAAADAYNEPGVFTSFRGFEWSNPTFGHVTVMNSDDYCTTVSPINTFVELCDWLNNRECIAFFNHPGYTNDEGMEFSHFATSPNNKFIGMELWTMDLDFRTYYYNDGYYSNDGNKGYYDEALIRNWKIGALGSEDNHYGTWGNLNDHRMAILANANTREEIYSALKAKRFYSTLDKNIALSFKINGNEMGSTLLPGTYGIQILASDGDGELFTQVQLLKNGSVVNTWRPNSATPDISSAISSANNDYYYVRVRQSDGDEAVSSPIWISDGNQFPVVSLSSPSANDAFYPPADILIAANANDADGTIAKVDFFQGSTLLGSVNTSPYTYNWTNVAEGKYTITAKATDNQGAFAISAPIHINVGFVPNQSPVVSVSNLIPGAIFTAPASVTIDASATDADGTITKVDFYQGSILLGTDYTSPYSCTVTDVAAGSYIITVKATDDNGATTISTPVTVIVNQPPAVAVSSPLSGVVLHAPASVTIDALATDEDGTITKVDFYQGSTLLGSDNTTPYSFSWTNVAAGSYTITAIATDNNGASTTSAPVLITVNQSPVVSISSPLPDAIFTAPASVTIDASATDADGTITKVDFYQGNTLLGSDNTTPYSFSWTNVAAGSYTITAKATDNLGALTISAPINITVVAPNQSPVVSVSNPQSGAVFTAPASITIDASATDADGTITKVDFYQGSTLIGSDNTTPYSFSWTNVAAGSYTITAIATDNNGASTTSAPVLITVNQSPAVAVSSPLPDSIFTAPASVTIDATATDADGTITKVDFYQGSTLLGSDNTSPYSFSWSNVAAGSYTITAKATDNLGALTISAPINITVKAVTNQPPVVSISSPVQGAIYTAPASVTLIASATDPDGTITKIDFYYGGTLLVSDNTSPYSYSGTNVSDGSYTITAVATDNSGASTTSTPVTFAVVLNQSPVVSISSPVSGAIFTAPASVTINAFATDADGTISKVDFYYGDVLLGSDNSSPYTYTGTNVPDGSYTITAMATDNSGASTMSTPVTFAVVLNQSPVVSISSPVQGAVFTAPASVTINAFATDADGTITKVDFYQGSTLLGSDSTTPYSFNWSNVAGGSYTITAKATDNLGALTISAPINITVGVVTNQPPVVSISSPVQGAVYTAPASVTLIASATDPDGTITKVDFYYGGALLVSDNTSPYSYTGTNVPEGSYTISAIATDNSGASTSSTPVTFSVVPNQSPVVSISTPVSGAVFTAPASVTINAFATDADGTITKVDFYQGSTLLGSDSTTPYSFNWSNVAAGSYTITAKATDNKGVSTTSASVSITINTVKSGIMETPIIETSAKPENLVCYPVPFTSQLHIDFYPGEGETVRSVQIFNSIGQCIITDNQNDKQIVMDLTNLKPGTYIVRVQSNKGLYSKLVVKN
jgi:hypothetical protein